MRPYVVRAILDQEGDTVKEFCPQRIRQAITPRTCEIMNDFLRAVVDSGTGYKAKVEGLDIAGKTGTAQKADLENGGYKEDQYLSSFVGYFPASEPKFVGIVYLDNPKQEHFGSKTAAPAFKNMAQRLAVLQDELLVSTKPSPPEKDNILETLMDSELLESINSEENLAYALADKITIPNALGMTVRQAAKLLSEKNINFKIKGSGVVKKQTPSAGSKLNPGQVCLLYCEAE